jgi:hypothetical protein
VEKIESGIVLILIIVKKEDEIILNKFQEIQKAFRLYEIRSLALKQYNISSK